MSHALIWTELNTTDLSSEIKKELPYVGFGTNYTGTWTKKLFKLKWLNSSVSDVKIWLDNAYADLYLSENYAEIDSNSNFHLINDLDFDIRITELDNFSLQDLPNAISASNANIGVSTLSGNSYLLAPSYVDGIKIDLNSLILIKSQTNKAQNGLYKVLSKLSNTPTTDLRYYTGEDILTAGKIVSVGSSSYYSYLMNYKPFEKAAAGSTEVIWVDRTSTYRLADVVAATTENLNISGSALTYPGSSIDNKNLVLNNRVLVKDQTLSKQNGIYYASSLYESDKNSIINPNTSGNNDDLFWTEALYNISQNKPVDVQVLNGDTHGGKFFRQNTNNFNVIPYLIPPPIDPIDPEDEIGGFGSTLSSNWTDATHFYNNYYVTWYYEVAAGSSIGFSYDNVSNAGIFTNVPANLINFNNNSIASSAGQSILVKHYNSQYSGIYTVVTPGDTWARNSDFDASANITPTIVKVENNKSSIQSQYFYLNKDKSYDNNFNLNLDEINISEQYVNYNYEDVQNLITSEITNFSEINSSKFSNSGIAISQRVLVSGQATTASQNGIYLVNSSVGNTLSLQILDTYSIKNGSIANSSGVGTTYFLYSTASNSSYGTTAVYFVDISSPTEVTADYLTSVDKFTNGTYINPIDFSNEINTGSIILVNTSNEKINGIYEATLGSAQKALFSYSDSIKLWASNILENILINSNKGIYTISPNLRKQNDGILLARNSGSFGDTSYSNTKFGDIYVPEIYFPSTKNSLDFFTTKGKSSSLIESLEIDWYEQDYQKFVAKAIYKTNNLSGFPVSAVTGINGLLSDGNNLVENDEILVYVGSGNSSYSNYNGIWRTVAAGSSFYFRKHEDFDVTSTYDSGKNIKIDGSPYERPTKVTISNGYVVQGSSFANTTVYMQGVLSYSTNSDALGIDSISAYDANQSQLGQNTFIKDSDVFVTFDYENLFNFPKISPIQHFVNGDLTNFDVVDGDILKIYRGYELFSTISNSNIKYYYEIGDRVIYQDPNEDAYGLNLPNSVNGLYQIIYINRNTWTYYLRKIKQNASSGQIDYCRRLKIANGFSINDGAFSLARYNGTGSTYYWSRKNYNSFDVFTVDSNGNTSIFLEGIDYEMYPEQGYISAYTSFGNTGTEFYCYIYQNNDIPRYNQVPKPIYNRYHIIDQVLSKKYVAQSSIAKTSGTYSYEKRYFQISNLVGNSTTTDYQNNTDRKLWFHEYSVDKSYFSNIKHLISIGSTNSYFLNYRQSQDGYYYKTGTALTSTFYENNFINPGTGESLGLYVGNFYIDKISKTGSGLSYINWYSSLNLTANDNVLIISDNKSSIASTLQSSHYDDNNNLVSVNKSGRVNQKILKFVKETYNSVTLSYHTSMTDPLTPLNVNIGISKYFLNYDPNNNSRSTANKKWFDYEGVDVYTYNVSSNSDISNLDDFGGLINSQTVSIGNTILLKDQTNSKLNGLYTVKSNSLWSLGRSNDLNDASHLKALGRVSYASRTYELLLPSSASYSIGNTAGNTSLIWNLVSIGQTIFASVATTANYSGLALTTSIPDNIDGYTPSQNDKIFLLSQSDATERYVGRYEKKPMITLARVTEGGSGNTSHFSITNCYVKDLNRNKEYELYFNPNFTGLGTSGIHWFERNYISDYNSADFKTSSNLNLTSPPYINGQNLGDKILIKDQTDKKQNGIYFISNNNEFYFLTRHENLDNSEEISLNKRVKVEQGNNSSGFYALTYDISSTPTINSSDIYWALASEYYNLNDCDLATLSNIDLNNPPTKIDGVTLQNKFRILVKDQTSKTQNGIYFVKDAKNKIWVRDNDLNNDSDIKSQLTVKISKGDDNADKIFRIVLPLPREITNSQLTEYILNTDNIEWIELNNDGIFNSDPSSWQKIGFGTTDSFTLGARKMDIYSVAYSNRFGIAIKSPSKGRFAGLGISDNGKIRNLKFKVEYKTIDD